MKTVLQEAKALLEKGWTQSTLARNSKGNRCTPDDSDAVCFCSIGAIESVRIRLYPGDLELRLNVMKLVQTIARPNLKHRWEDPSILGWNDEKGRTKEEVLAVFQQAIESLG